MPLINVQQLSINRSGVNIPAGTQARFFSDNFTRANSPTLGTQWGYFYADDLAGSNLSIIAEINANKCRFLQNAIAGAALVVIHPLPLAWMTQIVQNHFAESTIFANSAGFEFEVGTVMQPNICNTSAGCYVLQVNSAFVMSLNRRNWSANLAVVPTTTVLNALGGATCALGDILRLEARNVAGTWNLNAFKNGTSVGTTTDATFGAGMPMAMCGLSAGAVASLDMGTFNSGVL